MTPARASTLAPKATATPMVVADDDDDDDDGLDGDDCSAGEVDDELDDDDCSAGDVDPAGVDEVGAAVEPAAMGPRITVPVGTDIYDADEQHAAAPGSQQYWTELKPCQLLSQGRSASSVSNPPRVHAISLLLVLDSSLPARGWPSGNACLPWAVQYLWQGDGQDELVQPCWVKALFAPASKQSPLERQ